MLNTLAFRRVSPGEPVSAGQFNRVLEVLEQLSGIVMAGGNMVDGPNGPVFVPSQESDLHYIELSTDIVGSAHDRTVDELEIDPDVANGSDPWIDREEDQEFVMPPHAGLWLAGERSVVLRHSSAGKNLLLPFTQLHLGVTDGVLSKDSSVTVSIWEDQSSGVSDSGRNVTAYDWLLDTGQTIASGKRVFLGEHRQSRKFYVIGAQCAG